MPLHAAVSQEEHRNVKDGCVHDASPVIVHYAITAYGKDMAPGVPSLGKSMETLKSLIALFFTCGYGG